MNDPAGNDFEVRLRNVLQAEAALAPLRSPLAPPADTSRRSVRRAGRRKWAAAGIGVPAMAALVVAIVAYSPGSAASPAAAATPAMLAYYRADAPAIAPLLSDLSARARRLPALRAAAGEYLFQETESWNLSVSVSHDVASSTVVPEVEEVWSAAGSPRRDVRRQAPPVAPGPLTSGEENAALHAVAYGPPESIPVAPGTPMTSISGLPLKPTALFRVLATAGDGRTAARMSSQVDVGRALENLMIYLQYSPPTPALLSSAYRMLAMIPGVSDAGRVTDRAGREGVAIAVPVGGPGYEHSYRIIVNPGSGQLLGAEDIQIDPSGVRIPTPFVFHYVVFVRPGITRGFRVP